MSHNTNHLLLLRLLKGAPMSILYAFEALGEPAYPRILCILTGYPKDEVLPALQLLQELDLAVKRPDGKWVGSFILEKHESLTPSLTKCPN